MSKWTLAASFHHRNELGKYGGSSCTLKWFKSYTDYEHEEAQQQPAGNNYCRDSAT